MPDNVIILGGKGTGTGIADAIKSAEGKTNWKIVGFLNDLVPEGSLINGFPVLGGLKDSAVFIQKGYYFINTILRIDGQQARINLIKSLQIPEKQWATFIHPMAYVAPSVKIGAGCVIMPHASVSAESVLGNCTLVMPGAVITHDVLVGSFCRFGSNCSIAGYVTIADGVHISLNSSVRENCKIGLNSSLGMGSALLENIGEEEIWAGVPAKFIRKALP